MAAFKGSHCKIEGLGFTVHWIRERDKLGEAAPAHRRLGLALPVQAPDLVALAA